MSEHDYAALVARLRRAEHEYAVAEARVAEITEALRRARADVTQALGLDEQTDAAMIRARVAALRAECEQMEAAIWEQLRTATS
jgi:flagellin-like hook-associated protein FlgL